MTVKLNNFSHGAPSHAFALQQENLRAVLAGNPPVTPMKPPVPINPMQPTEASAASANIDPPAIPEPPVSTPRQAAAKTFPERQFDITLTFNPPSGHPGPGFTLKFKSDLVDTSDPNFIAVDVGPHLSFSLTDICEDLTLQIGSTAYPVSWMGNILRFPARDIYAISFIRRETKK